MELGGVLAGTWRIQLRSLPSGFMTTLAVVRLRGFNGIVRLSSSLSSNVSSTIAGLCSLEVVEQYENQAASRNWFRGILSTACVCQQQTVAYSIASRYLCHQQTAAYSKAAKQRKKMPADSTAMGDDSLFDAKEVTRSMEKALDHLRHEYANMRTGRASPGMLDHLKVLAYGERVPLNSVATCTVRDPQLLALTVFDPSVVGAVETAVLESPLGLNPRVEGQEVLVPIPRPSAESIAAMKKLSRQEAEGAKVGVRQSRKQALDIIKKMSSEDDKKRAEKEVQKLTDQYIAEIDTLEKRKEKDFTML